MAVNGVVFDIDDGEHTACQRDEAEAKARAERAAQEAKERAEHEAKMAEIERERQAEVARAAAERAGVEGSATSRSRQSSR